MVTNISEQEKKAYASRCRAICYKMNLPFELCLTLGTDEALYGQFLARVNKAQGKDKKFQDVIKMLFSSERGANKQAVYFILGRELSDKLKVNKGGKNYDRVLDYLRLKLNP